MIKILQENDFKFNKNDHSDNIFTTNQLKLSPRLFFLSTVNIQCNRAFRFHFAIEFVFNKKKCKTFGLKV